ncbi:MAG TPA: 2-oxo acid dehydrogenase subunit E2 [Nocardioides sp.]|nr:2-oxo acid dehydrogenase subunit E2 [Nocardioides sp.]
MPEVADDPTVATLTAWLVLESGDFAGAQSIATVETDSSLVSIEVAEPGVLIKSLVAPGDRVEPGSPLAVLGAPGEVIEDVEQLMVELGLAVSPEASDAHAHLRAVPSGDPLYATTWPPHEPEPGSADEMAASPEAEASGEPVEVTTSTDEPFEAAAPRDEPAETVAPPAETVARPIEVAPPIEIAPAVEIAPVEELVAAASADPRDEPVVVRRVVDWADTVAEAVVDTVMVSDSRSLGGAPVATPRQVQLREVVAADQLSAVFSSVDAVSLIALVVKAVATTTRQVPLRPDVLAVADVAVQRWTPSGPVAPVVRVANLMTVSSLTTTLSDVEARARDGRLASGELEPAMVTVVDLGAEGVAEAALDATVGHPAVLTVGALREQAVVENGVVVPGTVLALAFSCDADRINAAAAARWLAHLVRLLEQPLLFLT